MSRDHDNDRGGNVPRPRAATPATARAVDPSFVKKLGSPSEPPPPAQEAEPVSISGISQVPLSGSFANVGSEEIEAARVDDEDGRPLLGGNTRRIRPDSTGPNVIPRDVRIGETLVGRYRIEKQIGKGGMGRVYLATQFPLNRAVAVKILSPEFQKKDPQFVRRFFLEAATAARLNHPNTITVYDYGETERGELFIAMEYLKGRPLSRVISAEGPFSAERCIHISMQIIRALREAHAKGIIHRDLKPGNIMILDEGDDADFAKVLDFGLVKLFNTGADNAVWDQLQNHEEGAELTRAGMFLGSPKYMSPEQIQGHDLDPRTDIYSLGIIMYQMLTGRVPFRGTSSVEIIYKHVNQPVPAIHELNPETDVPPELETIVQRTLAKDRKDRHASMGDLLNAVKDVRRVVLGNSSVSGASLDLMSQFPMRDTGQVAAEMPGPVGPISGAISVRPGAPAASRSSIALPSTPPPSKPPAVLSPPAREAAFADAVGDESKAELLSRRGSSTHRPAALRLAPYVGAFGLLVGLGSAAYFLASPAPTPDPGPSPRASVTPPPVVPVKVPDPTPTPSPSTPPPAGEEPLMATLYFHSTPDGAKVYENGRLLGTTPFDHEVTRGQGSGDVHTYVFEKDGFQPETVREKIDTETLKIRTTLRPVAKPVERPEPRRTPRPEPRESKDPKPSSPDYKDNPY